MNIVIVGCGVAGITAAAIIRRIDSEATISIYTDENYLYYPRPDLYSVLSGKNLPERIIAFPMEWYEKRNIKVYLNRKASRVDTAKHDLTIDDGSKATYDKLLLANGAHPFVPPIKGTEKTGVFSLRSLEDAVKIRHYAEKARKAIIIGGGLLDLEFAASLRKLGEEVDVVEIFPRLLPMQLDQDGASVFQTQIGALGINVVLGAKTVEIIGEKLVSNILLDNGKTLSGDLVLFSAGVRCNTKLAEEAEIKVEKGIVVDQYLKTSADDVYAAGDVAEFEGKTQGTILAAEQQARIAATNMMGKEKSLYKGTIPSNTLSVEGLELTSMGLVTPQGSRYEEVKKINEEKGIYKKIVLNQGKIVGAIILGDSRSVGSIKRLMDLEIDVTKYKDFLLEDNFDFREILTAPTSSP